MPRVDDDAVGVPLTGNGRGAVMTEAYVIDAVRTAVGKRGGALAGIHPVDLGALAWRGLLDRTDIDPPPSTT